MPKLEIRSDSHGKRTVDFNGPSIAIGRQDGNDVVINDVKASRKHCVIKQNKGTFRISDLGSQNGTWLGQNRIKDGILALGDVVRIGSTFIRLLPDDVEVADGERLPMAAVIIEEDEELPPAPANPSGVQTTLAVRAVGSGPLSKQLSPLMEATVHVPLPGGAPQTLGDVVLLDRKSRPVKIDKREKARPSEALDAFRQLLFAAFRTRATDIHVEPKPDVYAIRFRIDGALHSVGDCSAKIGVAMLNIVKVLCQIDIAKKNIVQEGTFAVELPNRRVDMRVNLTPAMHGQKLALRFLDKASVPTQFENLGMELDAVAEFP